MTYKLRIFLLVLCFSFVLVSAQDELIELYRARMEAEQALNIPALVQIDSKLAESYLNQRKYAQARVFLENAIVNAEEPVLTDIKLNLYRIYMIESDFDKAESGLISIYFYNEDIAQRMRAAYLLGILNALKGKYTDSRKYLIESLTLNGELTPGIEKTLDSILADAKKRKNRDKAKWMSTFIPGSGQIYAKNAKGAIGAVGIAAFWGGWFVYDLIQKDYYSALLVLMWPWQRYHRGNIQNAELSVDEYNAKVEDGINRELLEFLGNR